MRTIRLCKNERGNYNGYDAFTVVSGNKMPKSKRTAVAATVFFKNGSWRYVLKRGKALTDVKWSKATYPTPQDAVADINAQFGGSFQLVI